MKRKRRQEKRRNKNNKTFLIVAQVHLGFLLPSALRRWACSSLPLCRRLAHYACNNNGNRLGQTFFLNSRQVAASGAASAQLSSARLCHHLGFRAKEIARLQFGHTTLPGYVFHLLLLLIPRYQRQRLPGCLLFLHLSRKAVTLMKNSIVSGSLHIHIAVRKVLS